MKTYGMHMPRLMARINRRVVNPIQRRYAGVIPGHGVVEHIGRRSGAQYRTPVLVFRTEGGFAMIVGYGLQSDWVKNLIAAGGGGLWHRRCHYVLTEPRLLLGEEGWNALSGRVGAVARLLKIEGVLRVEVGAEG